MKKRFTFLTAAMLLLMTIFLPWNVAGETTTYSLTPNQASTGSSATNYITTLTEFTYNQISWKMNQWNPKNLQVKTNQNSATSEFRYYNTSAFPGRITQVVMTFSALTVSDASKLMFLGGTSEVSATTGGTAGTWNSTDKTLTWTPGNSDNFTYFAFYQNGKAASGTNYLAESNAIVVTYETGGGGGVGSTYTVTYNANCGETPATWIDDNGGEGYSGAYTVKGNDNVNINFSNVGHDFGNWNTAANSTGTAYSGGYEINSLNSNLTLYAIWNPHTHNVTVNEVSHGTVTGYTNPVAYGTIVTLTYTPNDGQYYSATFSSDDVTITNGTFIMPDNDVSITVIETELPKYTVTFSDSGGTLTEAHYGAGVTLPTRTGDGTYSFAGWTTSNIAAETTTAPETILTGTYYPAGNITLYPVYTRSEGEGEKWQKITDFASVNEGTYALITTTGLAFTGTINSSGHGTVTTGSFSFVNNEATSAPSGTCELTLTAVIDNDDNVLGYTMYNSDLNYLYASKAGSGGLSWHETEDDYWHITNKFSSNLWSYSKDYSGNYAFLRTYSSNGTYTFRTYSSGGNNLNGATFYFVKKVSLSTTYYISTLSSIAVPSFDPTSKNFSTENLSVTISVADGCFIKYTLDNTDPLESGTTSLSNSVTLTLTGTTTIRALTKNGDNYSAEASQTYTRVYEVTLNSNGVAAAPVEVVTGESTTLAAPSNIPAGFGFKGWTATPATPNTLVSNTYTPNANITLYAVFGKEIYGDFKKVTSEPSNWSGYYLIVFETRNVALDGSLVNMDVSKNTIDVSIDNSGDIATIATDEVTNASKFMFAPVTGGYSIRSASSYYIGRTGSTNGLDMNATTPFVNTLSYSSGPVITSSGGPKLLCWSQGGAEPTWKISYYASNQNAIQLYKQEVISTEGNYLQAYPTNTTATANITIEGPTVIESGAVLNMGGFTLTCNNPANLVIKDGAQLKVYTTGAKDGGVQATVEKNITGYGNDDNVKTGWNFIASPITNEYLLSETAMVSSNERVFDLYRLNNTTWENYKNNEHADFTALDNGTGYLYASSNDITLSFAGTIKPFTTTGGANEVALADGWNLVGNPYTFDVYVNQTYYSISQAQEGITAITDASYATAIKPCTGILVYAESIEYVEFSENEPVASTGNHGNIQMTLAHKVATRDGNRSETIDNAIVSFNEDAYLEKFYFGEPKANIYIPQNGRDYAIAFSNRQGDVPLNFKTNKISTYTISFEGKEMNLNGVYLIDMLEEEEIDLGTTPSYTFLGSPSDKAARFKIVFRNTGDDADSDIFAYQNGTDIIVSGEGELQIFDVMGRKVSSQRINGVETMCTSSLQNGVYVFRLNEKTQKIVVR